MQRALLLLLLAGTAAASPAPLTLERQPASLMWGRFKLQLPSGMKVVPLPRDSQGLTMPRVHAGRAELVRDDGHLVMTIADTHTIANGDFARAVRDELALGGVRASTVTEVRLPTARAVLVEPPLPQRSGDSNLIFAAYVRGSDGRVVVVAFYAFGDLLDDIDDWAWIAREAVMTLEDSGAPTITRHESMAIGDQAASLIVPAGWVVHGLYATPVRTAGLMIHEVVPLGRPARSCSIDDSAREAPPAAFGVRVSLLGTSGLWRTWTDRAQVRGEVEIVLGGHHLRVACKARSLDELRGARQIVDKMTLQGECGTLRTDECPVWAVRRTTTRSWRS